MTAGLPTLTDYDDVPRWGKYPVRMSEDLTRVLALPRRQPPDMTALRVQMTAALKRDNPQCKCASRNRPCITSLNAVQAWGLVEAYQQGGVFGAIGTGHGKTGLDVLTPLVMPGCKRAVLFISANLLPQFLVDYEAWAEHFLVPNLVGGRYFRVGVPSLEVITYEKFSRADGTDYLERQQPDLIIADEMHKLRNLNAARTLRFMRYFSKYEATRFCGWSGNPASRSIKDWAHLSALALREGSPAPLQESTVEEWSGAIDPAPEGGIPTPVGKLRLLANPGESIREAFKRRLVETPGVVSTSEQSTTCTVVIGERDPGKLPPKLAQMRKDLMRKPAEGGWVRPDGEELVDLLQVMRCARELASGYYLRWRFPRGEPEAVIDDWFAKRKTWHRELRDCLKNPKEHMDSPLLCAKAAIRSFQKPRYRGALPVWHADSWPDWREIATSVYHESECVWVDTFLARDAAEWAKTHTGIVWVESPHFGHKVAELSGCVYYGGGKEASENITHERGNRSIIASIDAHGTGKNLQMFADQLVAQPPSDGTAWEQMLSRTVRPGQTADEVTVEVYRHTPEVKGCLDKARSLALYIQETTPSPQKLVCANFTF